MAGVAAPRLEGPVLVLLDQSTSVIVGVGLVAIRAFAGRYVDAGVLCRSIGVGLVAAFADGLDIGADQMTRRSAVRIMAQRALLLCYGRMSVSFLLISFGDNLGVAGYAIRDETAARTAE